MSLRKQLIAPLVVNDIDGNQHSYTVVFLHRFPESITDEQLRDKVLCQKLSKNHKTLREQFPTVRWVFPFGKAKARPWNNLTPEDRTAVGMTRGAMPYITQLVLQEAKRVGGLGRIVLGGLGEAAEAAHEAMSSFPECKADDDVGDVARFIQQHFHSAWTDLTQLKLAGFVGMHAQDGEMTRDVKNLAIMSKQVQTKQRVNTNIVINMPHRFIHGGYKVQNETWDGKRVDEFAEFLEGIGVYRVPDEEKRSNESLTPKDRTPVKKWDPRENLNDVQKHALEVEEQKKADALQRQKILVRIEADKVERKILQERQRQKRMFAQKADTQPGSRFTQYVNVLGGPVNENNESFAASGQSRNLPGSESLYSAEYANGFISNQANSDGESTASWAASNKLQTFHRCEPSRKKSVRRDP